jgi:hypothetical protein
MTMSWTGMPSLAALNAPPQAKPAGPAAKKAGAVR